MRSDGKISLEEKILFLNNLSGMLTAGVSMNRALSILNEQNNNQNMNKVLDDLHRTLERGESLSSGMSNFPAVFTPTIISMISTGEESNSLPTVLLQAGNYLQKSNTINRNIKRIFTYPCTLFSFIVLIGIIVMVCIIPKFAQTFTNLHVAIPYPARVIVSMSDFIRNQTTMLLVIVVFVYLFFVFLNRFVVRPRYQDFLLLQIPFIGTFAKEINTARITRSISSLLSAGVDLVQTLVLTKDAISNIYYKELLDKSIIAIKNGNSFSSSFRESPYLYPIMMEDIVGVGEENGTLSKMLADVALFYETEVESKAKDIESIIEPVFIIVITGLILYLTFSIVWPLYSLLY